MRKSLVLSVSVGLAFSVACGGHVVKLGGPEGGSGGGAGGGSEGGGAGGFPSADASSPYDAGMSEEGPTEPEDGSPKDAPSAVDVPLPPLDAALASLPGALPGFAGFGFIVNDIVQQPYPCTGDGVSWEFPPYPGTPTECRASCPGIKSVILVNTGALEMPYIAGATWALGETHYAPGVTPTGFFAGKFSVGVLAPGAYVDITSNYVAGMVALVGSAEPFSPPDAGLSMDEGTIAWPKGVSGSGGETTMYIAEIQVLDKCGPILTPLW